MRRALLSLLACVTAALALPSGAGAVTVAVGSHGRALMTWNTDAGLWFAERTADARFSTARTIAPPKFYPAFLSSGPGSSATILADDESSADARRLVTIRRADGRPRSNRLCRSSRRPRSTC